MVRCQLFSDIHLEFYKPNPGKSRDQLIDKILDLSKGLNVKYLFLAGDIANNDRVLKKFLITLFQSGIWEKIFYLPGNHEYYGRVRSNIRDSIRAYQTLFDDTEFEGKIICIGWSNILV